ncbi:hypothetical protein G5714_020250 [Onychostoma macrolepis]|uniref:Uncharacterized protein n=1 Tax=Onychostoma macrolepis TaxID=369639 RepID=A0A7J6BTA0_9TELE|nr:hypothetical protein G5714_020250 [Onychostoma macrolepis]
MSLVVLEDPISVVPSPVVLEDLTLVVSSLVVLEDLTPVVPSPVVLEDPILVNGWSSGVRKGKGTTGEKHWRNSGHWKRRWCSWDMAAAVPEALPPEQYSSRA